MRLFRARFVTAFSVAATSVATAAGATTIQLIDDSKLLDRSPLVVVAAIETESSPLLERPATDWTVTIERVLKGFVGEGRIIVRLPGGQAPGGLASYVYGTPPFAPGRRAILFLVPRADGTFALADFPQGSFLLASTDRRALAFRDLSEVRVLQRSGRVGGREPLRDFDRFSRWLEDRASGAVRPVDYLVRPERSELQSITKAFTLLDASGVNLRWTQFDSGGSVRWFSHTTPLPGLSGGGVNELQRAMAVWNDEATTPIRLTYVGTNSATGGTKSFDNVNQVLWTDLGAEIEGTFNCATGGTLAQATPWYDPDSSVVFNGKTYRQILGGDVIFNDGIECRQSTSPNYSEMIEEIAAHELGHTLGLAHSSERASESNLNLKNALMYFRVKDAGRGAVLNSDDVAAIQTLYRVGGAIGGGGGGGGGGGSKGCPAGTGPNTLCLEKGRFRVTGTWSNQFNGTSGTAGVIPYTDVAGFLHFGDVSNIELLVKILDFGTEFKVFYSQMTNLRFQMTVLDTVTGRTHVYSNTSGECGAIDGTTFRTASALTSRAESPEALAASSCSSSSNRLCLQSGRISVTGTWRNQYNATAGTAQAASISQVTGGLFFLDRTNLEVLIKAIDFGSYFLVIYGSLSDLEYDLTVTDHVSGISKVFHNAPGNYCGVIDGDTFRK